ncbi:MAG: hypothetical protein H6Q30_3091 [Bacteroidetes bacterium]|nr:hypothetical protein [Bacteroidota bacterium]
MLEPQAPWKVPICQHNDRNIVGKPGNFKLWNIRICHNWSVVLGAQWAHTC